MHLQRLPKRLPRHDSTAAQQQQQRKSTHLAAQHAGASCARPLASRFQQGPNVCGRLRWAAGCHRRAQRRLHRRLLLRLAGLRAKQGGQCSFGQFSGSSSSTRRVQRAPATAQLLYSFTAWQHSSSGCCPLLRVHTSCRASITPRFPLQRQLRPVCCSSPAHAAAQPQPQSQPTWQSAGRSCRNHGCCWICGGQQLWER